MKPKSFMLALALITLGVLAFNAKAQDEDYVVTLKGDTLRCKITSPFFSTGKYRYKLPDSAEAVKVDVKVLEAYYIAKRKKLFRSVYISAPEKAEFMLVVENGELGLYESTYTRLNSAGMAYTTTEWFIGKKTDQVMPIKTDGLLMGGKSAKKRRQDLAELFKDKPDVYAKYNKEKKFSFEQIEQLVRWYNTGNKPENQGRPIKDDVY